MKYMNPYKIGSVAEQHRILSLPKPTHPMVSIFNFKDISYNPDEQYKTIIVGLYAISLKRDVCQKVVYGQNHYDFDEGIMSFIAPGQLISNIPEDHKPSGWCLTFHPDFIRKHALELKIRRYHFFTYEANEALHLSEKEEKMIISILTMMQDELEKPIDTFSEDVLISYIELLLSYSERFYNRQFITRRNLNKDIIVKFEQLLQAYFEDDKSVNKTIPTVQYFSGKLNLSPNYLAAVLKSLTGKSTQQYIQDALIEKAKSLLVTTDLSVAEIAYLFGFEYPQSFNKLFKKRVEMSPLEYRKSFN